MTSAGSMSTERSDRAFGLTTEAAVPAELRFLDMIRVAVRVALDGSGSDPDCDADLCLASDELATLLIAGAETRSSLQLSVTHDRGHAYVRMLVPRAAGGSLPPQPELSGLLLAATVDAYQIGISGGELVGTLRRRLRG
jgi:hypothetical protein